MNSCSLVFPTRSIQTGEWTRMSGFGQMLDKLKARSGTKNWTLYDLRRTYRSMLSEMGYDLDLCERMIAHTRGSLVEDMIVLHYGTPVARPQPLYQNIF